MVRERGDLIEQGRQDCFGWRWLRGLKHTQHPFPNIRRNRLQSSDEVRQKAYGVAIPCVQGQPDHRPVATSHPCADQRGFPKASGGSDEGQFAVQALVQPLEQAGAADHVRPKPRDIQFRGENWCRHELIIKTRVLRCQLQRFVSPIILLTTIPNPATRSQVSRTWPYLNSSA